MNLVTKAIQQVGLPALAKEAGVRYQSVMGWERYGRLPRSEFTGETQHAKAISRAVQGQISEAELLDWSRKGWAARKSA